MSSRSFESGAAALRRMIVACVTLRLYAQRTNEVEFFKRAEVYDAICMQISQLGEQVSQLEGSPERIPQHFPHEVEWSELKGLRNRIGHNYASIDAKKIWEFVTDDVEATEQSLKRILKKRFGL